GGAELVAGIDLGLADAIVDSAFVDTEVLGDLEDRGVLVPAQCYADDVITEIFQIGSGYGVHPSRLACEQARSNVASSHTIPFRIIRQQAVADQTSGSKAL